MLDALDEAKVTYALVGGLAVAVWGAPRATKDIDLLVEPSQLPVAMAALKTRGFTLPALPFEFKDGSVLQRTNKVDSAGQLTTVDFLVVNQNLMPVWNTRMFVPFADRKVSVISRDALIAMKASAGRPQDIADIQNLQEIDR